jgi:hypothetical protein
MLHSPALVLLLVTGVGYTLILVILGFSSHTVEKLSNTEYMYFVVLYMYMYSEVGVRPVYCQIMKIGDVFKDHQFLSIHYTSSHWCKLPWPTQILSIPITPLGVRHWNNSLLCGSCMLPPIKPFVSSKATKLGAKSKLRKEPSPSIGNFSIPNCDTHKCILNTSKYIVRYIRGVMQI